VHSSPKPEHGLLRHRRSDARDRQCQRTDPTLRSVLAGANGLKSNPTLQVCLGLIEIVTRILFTRRRGDAEARRFWSQILALIKAVGANQRHERKSRPSRATLRASASPREPFPPQTGRRAPQLNSIVSPEFVSLEFAAISPETAFMFLQELL
jgi:hypothetical protein